MKKEKAKQMFLANPTNTDLFITSDGFPFWEEHAAKTHASGLKDTTVTHINKNTVMAEEIEKTQEVTNLAYCDNTDTPVTGDPENLDNADTPAIENSKNTDNNGTLITENSKNTDNDGTTKKEVKNNNPKKINNGFTKR